MRPPENTFNGYICSWAPEANWPYSIVSDAGPKAQHIASETRLTHLCPSGVILQARMRCRISSIGRLVLTAWLAASVAWLPVVRADDYSSDPTARSLTNYLHTQRLPLVQAQITPASGS